MAELLEDVDALRETQDDQQLWDVGLDALCAG